MGLDEIFNPRPSGADAPREGTYQWLRRGRPAQPVRILYGRPVDPLTGQAMDRSPRWQMWVAGQLVEPDPIYGVDENDPFAPTWADVWPRCAADTITYGEYRYLLERINYARAHDDADPFGQPGRRIDLRTATVPE